MDHITLDMVLASHTTTTTTATTILEIETILETETIRGIEIIRVEIPKTATNLHKKDATTTETSLPAAEAIAAEPIAVAATAEIATVVQRQLQIVVVVVTTVQAIARLLNLTRIST
jgi:hypothetical protein